MSQNNAPYSPSASSVSGITSLVGSTGVVATTVGSVGYAALDSTYTPTFPAVVLTSATPAQGKFLVCADSKGSAAWSTYSQNVIAGVSTSGTSSCPVSSSTGFDQKVSLSNNTAATPTFAGVVLSGTSSPSVGQVLTTTSTTGASSWQSIPTTGPSLVQVTTSTAGGSYSLSTANYATYYLSGGSPVNMTLFLPNVSTLSKGWTCTVMPDPSLSGFATISTTVADQFYFPINPPIQNGAIGGVNLKIVFLGAGATTGNGLTDPNSWNFIWDIPPLPLASSNLAGQQLTTIASGTVLYPTWQALTTARGLVLPSTSGSSGQYLTSNGTSASTWSSVVASLSNSNSDISLSASTGALTVGLGTTLSTPTTVGGLKIPSTNGSSGQYLRSNGTSASTWSSVVASLSNSNSDISLSASTGALTVGLGTTLSTPTTVGGLKLPTTNGSVGQYLTSNGTSASTWTSIASFTSGQFSATFSPFSGGGTSSTVSIGYQLQGNRATLVIPQISITMGSTTTYIQTSTAAIPSTLRPYTISSLNLNFIVCALAAGVQKSGFLQVSPDGLIFLYSDLNFSNFTLSTPANGCIGPLTITYLTSF